MNNFETVIPRFPARFALTVPANVPITIQLMPNKTTTLGKFIFFTESVVFLLVLAVAMMFGQFLGMPRGKLFELCCGADGRSGCRSGVAGKYFEYDPFTYLT
jgi:hypothetical protein